MTGGGLMGETTSNHDALREIAARVLPGSGRSTVERMLSGTSTPVYRVHRDGTTYYLRLAEGPEANLAPEALAHDLLRDRGVRLPEVVHFESFNQDVRRSVMVTTEIPGRSLAEHHRGIDVSGVVAAAGRDLAIISGIDVAGFGFVRRDRPDVGRLEGEVPTLRAFALGDLEAQLAVLPRFLNAAEIEAVRCVVTSCQAWLDAEQATLAHGDLDATHIFHQDGEYTGIIDFGEIRGADPLYDLGHFALHDGEKVPFPMLPHLKMGYGENAPLPPNHEPRIRLWSLLIGVRALARSANRSQTAYQDHLGRAIRKALTALPT
jgi:aminoglycoside phosphotransferase (APT) family kinase protein